MVWIWRILESEAVVPIKRFLLLTFFSVSSHSSSPFKTSARLGSRLCKGGFFHRYRELVKLAKKEVYLSAPTYWDAKRISKNYNLAKAAFREHLIAAEIGAWIAKPRELETFLS